MEFFTEEEEEEEEEDVSENLLDENGFPSLNPSSEPEDEEEEEDDDNGSIGVVVEEESFASDFYQSGTDWSCLVDKKPSIEVEEMPVAVEKKLKQTNLLQLWGLLKKPPDHVSSSTSTKCRVSSLPSKKKGSIITDCSLNASSSSSSSSVNPKVSRCFGKKRLGAGSQVRRGACPFYKKIPGTPFTVDAFRYGVIEGCSAYFLTHFHYDHYGGLSKGWSHGPIYCTPLTARLLRLCLSVNPSFICPLEMDTEYVINGIKVTMLEANHCPGAALIYFRLGDGRNFLHTGDFRACKMMQSHPLLLVDNKRINLLYLDTTYCNAKYRFPPIEDVLAFVVKVTKDTLKKQPKTLVIVGAYSIGKERVYLAISEALGVKIYTNVSRKRILQSFGWPELSGRLSSHAQDTPLHVLPISSLRHETLKQYLQTNRQFTSVLAFRPTGWTYSEANGSQLDLIKPSSRGNIMIYGVPYSEHSSFLELQEFVQFLRPEKIIPTVNIGNAAQRDKMQCYFRDWLKAS